MMSPRFLFFVDRRHSTMFVFQYFTRIHVPPLTFPEVPQKSSIPLLFTMVLVALLMRLQICGGDDCLVFFLLFFSECCGGLLCSLPPQRPKFQAFCSGPITPFQNIHRDSIPAAVSGERILLPTAVAIQDTHCSLACSKLRHAWRWSYRAWCGREKKRCWQDPLVQSWGGVLWILFKADIVFFPTLSGVPERAQPWSVQVLFVLPSMILRLDDVFPSGRSPFVTAACSLLIRIWRILLVLKPEIAYDEIKMRRKLNISSVLDLAVRKEKASSWGRNKDKTLHCN